MSDEEKENFRMLAAVKDITNMVKENLCDTSTKTLEYICDTYNIELSFPGAGQAEQVWFQRRVFELTQKVMEVTALPEYVQKFRYIDFIDMTYLPVAMNLPVQQFDWAFIR